jgi:pyridoxine kinase
MCNEMKKLISSADIITPNVTEACILTDMEYKKENWSIEELNAMAVALGNMGPDKVVITGIDQGNYIGNLIYEKNGETNLIRTKKVGVERAGTGDLFASILIADAVNQVPLKLSVKRAAGFIKKCILESEKLGIPQMDGVCFE